MILRTLPSEANAFGRLLQRHQIAVFNVCYRMMGTREEAEDLAQEAFIRLMSGWLHTFDPQRPLGPWIRTVAATPLQSIGSSISLILACLLPFVGWFVLLPYVGILGLGAMISQVDRRRTGRVQSP